MPWPSDDDYRALVQYPQRVFRDPKLQACSVETYPDGRPKGRQGTFAHVYRLQNGSWSTAVRFFKRPPRPDQAERYFMVHRWLQRSSIKGLLDFSYDPEGFRLGQQGFPVLTLQWVEGDTLGTWLKNAVVRNDAAAIGQMTDRWIELVTDLRSHGIAHGDLQHGNVMVENGRLVLVDYDCMFVPEMTTDEQRKPTEFGFPGYQHPRRAEQLLSAELDNFSAWVILIALRAIADDLNLWRTYVEARETENLLLTLSDLEQHDSAPIWDDLTQRARSKEVREWAQALRESITRPFDEIPPFGINVWEELEAAAAKGDWREIHTLATSAKYAWRAFPKELAAKVEQAIKRVDCLTVLGAKTRTNRARDIAAAYRPDLLDDWAEAAPLVARAKAAKGAVLLLDELDRAEKCDMTGRGLVALWGRRGRELQGLAEADDCRTRAEIWGKRIEAAGRVVEAVKRGTPEKAIVEAWGLVTKLGGHPDSDPHRSRAEQAARRVAALGTLAAVPTGQDEAADRTLLAAWDANQTLLDGCSEADPFRTRAAAACERARRLAELVRRIEQADHGRGEEEAVIAAFDALSPGYGTAQAARVAKARARIAATKALAQALRAVPESDLTIASAADRARADGSLPSELALLERCALAARRRDLLRALDAIPASLPLDEQDARWLGMYDAALLDPCHDARTHRARRDKAAARTETFAALERALSVGSAVEVKRLAREAVLADHPGLVRRRAEIEALIAASEKVERLLAAAEQNDAAAFLGELEPALLRANAAVFLPHRARIDAWVDAHLAKGGVLGPSDPPFLPDSTGYAVTARWTWRQTSLVRTCLVAADSTRFLARPDESRHGTQRLDPETYRRTKGGTSVSLPAGARKLYVSVWPVVDLGWDRRTGPPLKLGPYLVRAQSVEPRTALRPERARSRPWSETVRNWLLDLLNR
jgi:hypothetical protein